MNSDLRMFKWLGVLVLLPVVLAALGGDRFRYPCQDPQNWEKEICQRPACDVTRSCPDHIFKGQRDPRLGPNDQQPKQPTTSTPAQGVTCAK
jgi:hypothetical protein